MILIHVEHGEGIDKALKRYKNKQRNIKQMKALRENQFFTKPSVKRRDTIISAAYKNKKLRSME